MDLLMDINETPQIPPERRINVGAEDEAKSDKGDKAEKGSKPSKSLHKLLQEVPHRSYAATIEQFPEILDDLEPKNAEIHPTSFLSADDIDEYLAELDKRLGLKSKPSVPPPNASANGSPAANFALRNPTSVYNWLRKHAPKTFLQDLEKEKEKDKHKDKDKDKDDHGNGDKDEDTGKKRKGGTARTKRQSAAAKKEKEAAEAAEDEEVMSYSKPTSSAKGKRKRDEDPGYRPKGGSSRPSKKRKSGGGASTK